MKTKLLFYSSLLLLITISVSLVGCSKQKSKTAERYTHPRDGYTITIPDGWSSRIQDRVMYQVLTLLPDTTKPEGEQPEIQVISDNMRRPMDFQWLSRDALFKMGMIRNSSHYYEVLDSSRVEAAGREGIMYTFERIPVFQEKDHEPRHVVMIFLQAHQGMISLKYIAPKKDAKQYAELFNENLQSLAIEDLGDAISEEEYIAEQKRLREANRDNEIKQLKPRSTK
ncbi:hypothetical protein KQI63_13010 [bacterium]|nr:hypothetical protein [bacterium]